MSTSPTQPDPYLALGIDRDADIDTIKKAHRRLVLKHHPDRIKNPALIEQGKNEFQKVQQAYELLSDPARRLRYDDECRLAELRKERMTSEREYARTSSGHTPARHSYPMNPTPRSPFAQPPPTPREMRPEPQPRYEERVPESYFEPSPRFEQHYTSRMPEEPPLSRNTARKDPHSFERQRPSASRPSSERKEKPKASGWERSTTTATMRNVFNLGSSKASSVKKKAEEHAAHMRDAKARDKAHRSERMEKNNRTAAPYASSQVYDDFSSSESESSSDDDTVVFNQGRAPQGSRKSQAQAQTSARSSQLRHDADRLFRSQPRSRADQSSRHRTLTPEPPRNRTTQTRQYSQSDNEYESADEWEQHHNQATDYIRKSQQPTSRSTQRPHLARQSSEHQYWVGADQMGRDHRRSGSDSDRQRQKTAAKASPRTAPMDDRRPPMAKHTSAPSGVRSMASEIPPSIPRPRQGSYDSRVHTTTSHRQGLFVDDDQPALKRQNSEPMAPRPPMRQNTIPRQSSTLKQSELNHDSGYGSSSSPQTPEMGGTSPPRATTTSTKYKAKKTEDDSHHRARKVSRDGRGRDRRVSPEPRTRKASVDSRAPMETRGRAMSPELRPRRASPAESTASRATVTGGPPSTFLSPDNANILPGRAEERRDRRSSRSRDRDTPRNTSARPARRPSVSRAETSRHEEMPRRGRTGTDQANYKLPPSAMPNPVYAQPRTSAVYTSSYAPKSSMSRQPSVGRAPQTSARKMSVY